LFASFSHACLNEIHDGNWYLLANSTSLGWNDVGVSPDSRSASTVMVISHSFLVIAFSDCHGTILAILFSGILPALVFSVMFAIVSGVTFFSNISYFTTISLSTLSIFTVHAFDQFIIL
jgi:hypothetical protein